MKRIVTLATFLLVAACGRNAAIPVEAPTPTTDTGQASQPADPAFVGKVWISTTRGHAVGTMLIFLPDRTLVMDSCFETYRLTKWGVAGDHIRWLEDTIPIEAAVEMPRPNQLILRIAGIDDEQSYVTATVPFKCPDMPK